MTRSLAWAPPRTKSPSTPTPALSFAKPAVPSPAPTDDAKRRYVPDVGFKLGAVSSFPPAAGIQCKLRLGSPSDPLEHEADRAAERVLTMPDPGPTGTRRNSGAAGSSEGVVQRACAACSNEHDDEKIQRKRVDPEDEIKGKLTGTRPALSDVGGALEGRVRGLNGGEGLAPGERAFFEPRFGHDFSRVRLHAGAEAASVASALGARAFTRGTDVVFGQGEYAPGTESGRRLLAHELAHVVQQSRAAYLPVQRDLATPEPSMKPAAQSALTPAQIQAAIRFNRSSYDDTRTKQIQDLIGTESTGTWTEDDVLAVADLQETYGLRKDGMVGPHTFDFLDKETRLEKLPKTGPNCLLSFSVAVDSPIVGPVAGAQRSITGHHKIQAQFSKYCNCADYEYRQFIRGHWRRIRGGVITDLANTFTHMPGGTLPAASTEDGNTTTPALNFGHRDQANEGTNNGYFDDANHPVTTVNQASGCHYLGDDKPGGPDSVLPGDVFDVLVGFRGEIRRGGSVVETKFWNDINGIFPV
jgi:Domain of unknown function (DUF4157)